MCPVGTTARSIRNYAHPRKYFYFGAVISYGVGSADSYKISHRKAPKKLQNALPRRQGENYVLSGMGSKFS